MILQHNKKMEATIVALEGRMDAITSSDYEIKMKGLIASGERNFVVDFEKLDYISSVGLRAILATAKQIRSRNGKFLLANVHGSVKEIFAISGLGSIFPVYDSIESAMAFFV
jgi:stage II sporulation protein AA (anti-sigma F factor antagonist)